MASSENKTKIWRERVSAYKASGLTQRGYAEKEGLSLYQLKYWIYRLSAVQKGNSSIVNGPKFNPVIIRPESRGAHPLHQFKVTLGNGTKLEFDSTEDLNAIKSLVEIVGKQ